MVFLSLNTLSAMQPHGVDAFLGDFFTKNGKFLALNVLTKTHLWASVISKNFPGKFTPDPYSRGG